MANSMKLEGKVAIVLGAAGRDNMGQTIARRFADEGAKVVVAGRKLDELERFASTIGGAARTCDITRKEDVDALFAFARDWGGHVDVAVNATGWGLLKGFTETTLDELDQITDLQFKGPFYFCQAAVDTLGKGGSIIQISSATATIMLNDELVARFSRVAESNPAAWTRTPMTADAKEVPGLFGSFLSGYPLGRIGTKDDIAAAAVWLASDECFMTGQNLQVNGGLTLRRNPTREEIHAAIATATGQA